MLDLITLVVLGGGGLLCILAAIASWLARERKLAKDINSFKEQIRGLSAQISDLQQCAALFREDAKMLLEKTDAAHILLEQRTRGIEIVLGDRIETIRARIRYDLEKEGFAQNKEYCFCAAGQCYADTDPERAARINRTLACKRGHSPDFAPAGTT